jgi:N6-adenosine-specific RNA methylase IME4
VRFRLLMADCPWRFSNWSMSEKAKRGEHWARRNGRSPYDVLDTDTLCDLGPLVRDIAARDSVLIFWATWPKLEDALRVMNAWGWTFKTGLPWLKMTRAACPRVGLGYHNRSCSEPLLIGTRGKAAVPEKSERQVGAIFNPIGGHSAKPQAQYTIAEGYPGPYVELFARNRWPGWVSVGEELDGLDIRESLRRLAVAEPLPVARVQQPALAWEPRP